MARKRKGNTTEATSTNTPDVATTEAPSATKGAPANNSKVIETPEADPRAIKLGHKVEMTITPAPSEDPDAPTEEITKHYASKSQAIVDLYKNHQMSTSEIANALGIRYQFAYNVLKRNKLNG